MRSWDKSSIYKKFNWVFFFFFLPFFSGLKGKVIVGSWQNAFEVRELNGLCAIFITYLLTLGKE
jgi:hypothetical protein